ncbi:50S ribosomal protein L20 [Candidatus Mycoplasma haematohominis]|uniref:Large ribosomal subunit protein bL20 n=1 Tax=Candidatus Mycoplasma haematohominis TaxID=1494318 RepID=A0A478FQL6_9MOLU|nr:50S ribosomal protein L20 [Candidatus Mycoplasma haemohominis]GCE63763.1 50S ribosomal protein L20 [Candidatus Mycoplasma haemohominis]
MRVPGGYKTRQRRKKIVKRAEGYWGHRHVSYRTARQSLVRSAQYAFISRKQRKRDFRRLWILRINAAARLNGVTYSRFMEAMKKNNVGLNRKMLSEMAIHNPDQFKNLCGLVK